MIGFNIDLLTANPFPVFAAGNLRLGGGSMPNKDDLELVSAIQMGTQGSQFTERATYDPLPPFGPDPPADFTFLTSLTSSSSSITRPSSSSRDPGPVDDLGRSKVILTGAFRLTLELELAAGGAGAALGATTVGLEDPASFSDPLSESDPYSARSMLSDIECKMVQDATDKSATEISSRRDVMSYQVAKLCLWQ